MVHWIDRIIGTRPRYRMVSILAVVTLMSGMGACSQESSSPAPAPTASPQAEPVNPSVPAQPVTQQTRDTYQFYCTQCHGLAGKGDGVNARFLTVPPRDHTKADYLETRSDEQLFHAIQLGGLAVGRAPCMPAWGHTLDDDAIRSLVRHIRELCHCQAF